MNFGSLITDVFLTDSDLSYINLQYKSDKVHGLFGWVGKPGAHCVFLTYVKADGGKYDDFSVLLVTTGASSALVIGPRAARSTGSASIRAFSPVTILHGRQFRPPRAFQLMM